MEITEDGFLNKYSSIEAFNDTLTLEHFETIQKIGEGAFATVYKSRLIKETNSDIPDVVAIKKMKNLKLDKTKATEMVFNEVKLLASLSNDFIIDYYTSFVSDEYSCIVLKWMPYNLYEILQSKVYFGESTARFISSQIVLGLAYLHRFYIAYRDLKPENILMGENRGIKITDMSLSKYIPGRSYTTQGTVEYMAPEVVLSAGHGLAVDWWAFGIFLYELCAGHTPFRTNSIMNMMKSIIKARPKFPSYFTDEIKDLIKKLLVVDVSNRVGCMKGREEDIKVHSWFNGDVDWDDLGRQRYDVPNELIDLSDIRKTDS